MNIYTDNPDKTGIKDSIERLKFLVDTIPSLLSQFSDEEFGAKPGQDKWSKKEILGHLVDSASNNHQRFIRIQIEDNPSISYDQNQWVSLNGYHTYNKKQLIEFWKLYNLHLIHIIEQIPQDVLSRIGTVRSAEEIMPLYFYINDYVAHLEHHLRQLVTY